MSRHLPITMIVLLYLFAGSFYLILNPLWESPDEIHHFPMVAYLQTHQFQLPSQEPGTVGLWQQEGNQPPLYYLLGAALIAFIDTSDSAEVMRVNPHADIGYIRPDGNVNRIVHTQREEFPGTGAVLATYLLRGFSLLLGASTVVVTYTLARKLLPEQPLIALLASAVNAFIPMYLYISASVNNDNLSTLIANLLLLSLIVIYQRQPGPSMRDYVLLGALTGSGLLSKLNLGIFIPLIAITLLLISLRERRRDYFLHGSLVSGTITILIAGWWYWRNWQLYADPTGLNRFLEIVGSRVEPASLAQLWTEREGFIRTFWGLFGSINVPMPDSTYTLFTLFGGIGLVIGTGVILNRIIRSAVPAPAFWSLILLLVSPLLTFVALLRWTSITPASQGRLLYGAISSLAILIALGILFWFPRSIQRILTIGIIVVLFVISLFQPLQTIAPAYALPETFSPDGEPEQVFSDGQSSIGLLDARIITPSVQPGEYALIELDYEMLSRTSGDWSIFVHLVTPENIIIAQRDVYPGRGLLATSDLDSGYAWTNPIAVYIPPMTYAPTELTIRTGWYSLQTGSRLLSGADDEMHNIGTLELIPLPNDSTIPNPQQINFGNLIELVGYSMSTRQISPGEQLEIVLYWRALRPISEDYVVFANIIDPQTLTKYASSNAMPAAWNRPTSSWQPGEIVSDSHLLLVDETAPDGVFKVEAGLYLQQAGFPRLSIIGTYDNLVYLNPVRIERDAR